MGFYQACLCDCAGGPGVSWQDRGVSRQGWIRPLRCEYSAAAPALLYCFYMFVFIFEIVLWPDYAAGPLQKMM